jgi:magnesium-transporting ATPase (P-type)
MINEGITNVNFSDNILQSHMRDSSHENFYEIHRFMEILAVCHTVIVEPSKHSKNPDHLIYNASSPDELALVNAGKYFGYNFKGRDEDNNLLVEVKESADEMEIGSPVK